MAKIVVAGDFTTEGRGSESINQKTAFSKEITHILQNADITIANLEAPVVYHDAKPIEKIGPALKTTPQAISFLKENGVNLVTLANNHFNDYGIIGISDTIDILKSYKIGYVGGGNTEKELNKTLFLYLGDTTIALLNYCETEFSVQKGYGSHQLNPISLYYDLKEAKNKADIILVIIHGGHEGYNLPSPRMQQLYRYIVDLGTDVVINHHQHCYSGFEKYHQSYIYYGLGNFFFDDPQEDGIWNSGYLLEIEVDNKMICKTRTIPYLQCKKNDVCVRRMSSQEEQDFQKDIDKLNKIIADEKLLKKAFIAFCEQKKKNYWINLTPYSNRILKALCKRRILPSFINKERKLKTLNDIRCESHRDIMIESLK